MNLIRFTLMLLFCNSLVTVCSQKKISFRLSSGFKEGTYFAVGESLKTVPEFEVQNSASKGSIDNIMQIMDGKADLAITQLDVLQNYAIGEPKAKDKIKILTPLYGEEVHVLVNKSIKSFSDMKGKKISVGDSISGSKQTALLFLGHFDLDTTQIKLEEISPDKSLELLLKNELDGMVLTAGYPVKLFSSLPEKTKENFHFLEFYGEKYEAVKGTNLTYNKGFIPAKTYSFQDEDVRTIVVTSILAVKADMSEQDALFILKSIFSNSVKLTMQHEKWNSLNLKFLQALIQRNPTLFHSAVEKNLKNLQ